MHLEARVGLKRRSSGKVLTSGILRRKSRASCGYTEARLQAWMGSPPRTNLAWPPTTDIQLPELETSASVVKPQAYGVFFWFLGLGPRASLGWNFSLSLHGVCCLQLLLPPQRTHPEISWGGGWGRGAGNLSRPAGPPSLRGLCGWPAHPYPTALAG